MAEARNIVLEVMQEVQGVAKRDRNTNQGFNFRGIDAVINAVGPALRKAGGFIVPQVLAKETAVAQSAKGGTINMVHLTVSFSIFGSEGEPVTGTVVAEAMDSGDKATAKAMSVALRTFLLQLLALPTDEPDPDSFSYEAAPVAKSTDWSAKLDGLTTKDEARALYLAAQKGKAGKDVLDAITTKASSLAE